MTKLKIGIIKEGKVPADFRVALTPTQCRQIIEEFPVDIAVHPSEIRCYTDEEYRSEGISVTRDLDDCDILLGIKEVPVSQLLEKKTYMFFSHTIKAQEHNRGLLMAVLNKNIRLIDYEVLLDVNHRRLIAFGHFAGMVGAHNAIYAFGKRMGSFDLVRLKDCKHYQEAREMYAKIKIPNLKVVLTGAGRVATGAAQVLRDMGFYRVSPEDYLSKAFNIPVFTQVSSEDYAARKDGKSYEKIDFYSNPQEYESCFAQFYETSDIMINGIFWDTHSPHFFTIEEMRRPAFKIQVIADISCDIAPVASVPSTLRASSIENPVYGFDPATGTETIPYLRHVIDVMAIDNLPNELPRDASEAFGKQFVKHIIPEFIKPEYSLMLEKATVAVDGKLGSYFKFLSTFVNEKSTI